MPAFVVTPASFVCDLVRRPRFNAKSPTRSTPSCPRFNPASCSSPSSPQVKHDYPSVHTINTSPTATTSAFFISSSHVVTVMHSMLSQNLLPTASEASKSTIETETLTLNIDGRKATLFRRCDDADIAVFKIAEQSNYDDDDDDDDDLTDRLAIVDADPAVTYSILTTTSQRIPVNPIEVNMIFSTSGALVPFIVLDHELEHTELRGWSGCPVIRDDNQCIIGMLAQGDEHFAYAVPATTIAHVFNTNQLFVWLNRLPRKGLAVQPLIDSAARDVFPSTLMTEKDTETNEDIDIRQKPRVCRISANDKEIKINDQLIEIHGRKVLSTGNIVYGGFVAPLEAIISRTKPTEEYIDGKVLRRNYRKYNDNENHKDVIEKDVRIKITKASTIFNGNHDRRMITTIEGLIFIPLTIKLFDRIFPPSQLYYSMHGPAPLWFHELDIDDSDKDVIILIGIDESVCELHTESLALQKVKSIDGMEARNLSQLKGDKNEKVIVEFDNGYTLKLSKGQESQMPLDFFP